MYYTTKEITEINNLLKNQLCHNLRDEINKINLPLFIKKNKNVNDWINKKYIDEDTLNYYEKYNINVIFGSNKRKTLNKNDWFYEFMKEKIYKLINKKLDNKKFNKILFIQLYRLFKKNLCPIYEINGCGFYYRHFIKIVIQIIGKPKLGIYKGKLYEYYTREQINSIQYS